MIDKTSCYLTVAKSLFGFSPTTVASDFKRIPHGGFALTRDGRDLVIYCDPIENEDNLSVKFKYRGPEISENLLESGTGFFTALYESEGVSFNTYRDNRNRFVLRMIVPKGYLA